MPRAKDSTLQTLGTLINVDLPWNPSRLEQRLGRIKRFGQARRTVDMLNLVYHDTQDEKVYQVLSRRLKDKFDIFGGLPDTIEDDWIESVEKLEAMMDQYIHLRQRAETCSNSATRKPLTPTRTGGNSAPACWRERTSSRNCRNRGSGIARSQRFRRIIVARRARRHKQDPLSQSLDEGKADA